MEYKILENTNNLLQITDKVIILDDIFFKSVFPKYKSMYKKNIFL